MALGVVLWAGCGSNAQSTDGKGGGGGSGSSSGGGTLFGDAGAVGDGGGGSSGPGVITAVIRDFKFFDAADSTTDPDFENPPYNINETGMPAQGYIGPWDDPTIVTNALGVDNKPVYASATGTTLTTHGKAAFDLWFNDTSGTNIPVNYPLPLTQNADGSSVYDSNQSGQLYVANDPSQGRGFFPIDDGTPYATMFGNQGKPHNYSFTMEIHTVFTYQGGEYFNFRGDDDVFVYVNGALVINLGGVHRPEAAQVNVDSLGLTQGKSYPLDFFSAERHVTGSNILFQTTLKLQPLAQ